MSKELLFFASGAAWGVVIGILARGWFMSLLFARLKKKGLVEVTEVRDGRLVYLKDDEHN